MKEDKPHNPINESGEPFIIERGQPNWLTLGLGFPMPGSTSFFLF